MKNIREAAIVVAMGLAAGSLAAQTTHTESTTKHTGAGPNTKMKTESVTGPVKSYEAGKKITVTGPENNDHSFDLDTNAKVHGSVAVGQTVTVEYRKGDGGNKVVTVSPGKGASNAMNHSAHAGAAKPPAGGTMHTESTTKHTGPGDNTKVTTETVVGTVKSYEAGKSITVTGPKDEDFSFDLDEGVAMEGSAINVGSRVKVTFTKGDNGEKVTTIAPYTEGKKKIKKTKTTTS